MDSTATSKYDYEDQDKTYTTYNPHLMRQYVGTSKTSGTVRIRIRLKDICYHNTMDGNKWR
jgi:hypothetical protein